ncbi:MAG: C39 family peptidase [Pirellulales bacterium]|nr:C39 family peptidase [Pirellulales bacterium]
MRQPILSDGYLTLTIILLVAFAPQISMAEQRELPAPIRDPERRTSKYVQNWAKLKERNVVMQRRDYSCGAAALATLARYYWGDNVDEEYFLDALDGLLTLEEVKDRVKNGLAMSDLRKAAVKTGYQAVVGKVKFQKLAEAKVPLIVGITVNEYDHFVVYRGTDFEWVYLADPIRGNLRIGVKDFLDQWQENAILAIHKPGKKVRETSPLTVRDEEKSLGELNRQIIRTFPTRRQLLR